MEIIAKKTKTQISNNIYSLWITWNTNPIRIYTKVTSIIAWWISIYTKSEIDQKLEYQDLYYVKQW